MSNVGFLHTLSGFRNTNEGNAYAAQIETRHAGGQYLSAQVAENKPKFKNPSI